LKIVSAHIRFIFGEWAFLPSIESDLKRSSSRWIKAGHSLFLLDSIASLDDL